MRNRLAILMAAVGVALSFVASWQWVTAAGAPPVPAASGAVANPSGGDDGGGRYIIYLEEGTVFDQRTLPLQMTDRRTYLISNLQATADQTQGALRLQLEAGKRDGRVTAIQPLWIVNAIVVEGDAAWIESLDTRPDVDRVVKDEAVVTITQAPDFDPHFFEPSGVSNFQVISENIWHRSNSS